MHQHRNYQQWEDLGPVAAGQHGAFDVEVSGAGGVAAEQPSLMTVIDEKPVAVAKTKVAIEVGDGSSTVSRSFVINGDPMAAIITISNDSLWGCRRGAPSGSAVNNSLCVILAKKRDTHISVALHLSGSGPGFISDYGSDHSEN